VNAVDVGDCRREDVRERLRVRKRDTRARQRSLEEAVGGRGQHARRRWARAGRGRWPQSRHRCRFWCRARAGRRRRPRRRNRCRLGRRLRGRPRRRNRSRAESRGRRRAGRRMRRRARSRRAGVALQDAARRHAARDAEERARHVHIVVHAPGEVLVEGHGVPEHGGHACDAVNRPITEVLVKGRSVTEHRDRVRDAVDRPITDVSVKGRGVVEHVVHGRDAGGVPRADVLVKRRRSRVAVAAPGTCAKQILHVRHAPSRPRRNVAVRRLGGCAVREPRGDCLLDFPVDHDVARARNAAVALVRKLNDAARRRVRRVARGAAERVVQVQAVGHAPAEVLVEGRGAAEHLVHVRDAVDRPTTDVLVEG
jgi:hypothetical protein